MEERSPDCSLGNRLVKDIAREPRDLSGQPQMRQARGRYPIPPPAMHGGSWRVEHLGDGGCPAEPIDDFVGIGFHKPKYATIADRLQAEICDNSSCDYRIDEVHRGMNPEDIKAALAERNWTIRDLAERTGINENYLSKSLGKARRRIQVPEMEAIYRAFGMEDAAPAGIPIRTIPHLGEVPGGPLRPAMENAGRFVAVSDPDTPPGAYALTVKGDSMDLVVDDGATLVIDPNDRDLWPGRRYVIRTEDGETTFKEYQAAPARLVPCSSNPNNREIAIGHEPIMILGRVFSYIIRDVPRRKA